MTPLEVNIIKVGQGDEIAKFGLQEGDRVGINDMLGPVIVNNEQKLLVHVHDVLFKIEGWEPEDKVKPIL